MTEVEGGMPKTWSVHLENAFEPELIFMKYFLALLRVFLLRMNDDTSMISIIMA